MNWYRQSKLIDKKSPTDDKSIHPVCSYCDRWATHNDWKSYDQLTDEERIMADSAKMGLLGDHYLSHGICPTCWANMEYLMDQKDPKIDAYSLDRSYYKKLALQPERRKEILDEIMSQNKKRR